MDFFLLKNQLSTIKKFFMKISIVNKSESKKRIIVRDDTGL